VVKAKPISVRPFGWLIIVEVVGGLAVVGLLVYFFVVRRRKSKNTV